MIGHGAVLIGMGERTTPMAIEIVARALFAAGQATKVVAIELPPSHAFMHLDTVMSMVNVATGSSCTRTSTAPAKLDGHPRGRRRRAGDRPEPQSVGLAGAGARRGQADLASTASR